MAFRSFSLMLRNVQCWFMIDQGGRKAEELEPLLRFALCFLTCG